MKSVFLIVSFFISWYLRFGHKFKVAIAVDLRGSFFNCGGRLGFVMMTVTIDARQARTEAAISTPINLRSSAGPIRRLGIGDVGCLGIFGQFFSRGLIGFLFGV